MNIPRRIAFRFCATVIAGTLCPFFLPIAVRAQQSAADIEPKVEFVTLPDSPLRWAGQKATIEDELSEVLVQNIGKQAITAFQLGWILLIPEGCGVREGGVPRSEVRLSPYYEQTVLPSQTVTVGPYHLSAESIRNFARHAHSPVVVAQAGVVRMRIAGVGETIYPLEDRRMFTEPTTPPCQLYQKSAEAEDSLKTFQNHEFSFQYASLLNSCEKKEFETGDGYSWEPDSCNAYSPVCDDQGGQGAETLACIAYPNEKFRDAPTFQAAAFSVASVEGARSEKDCVGGDPYWAVNPRGSVGDFSINGVKFKVFEVGDAGLSHVLDGHVYRTFHAGRCLQLAIRWAMVSEGAFDEGEINRFTKEDFDEVRGRLEQVRDSFRFVK